MARAHPPANPETDPEEEPGGWQGLRNTLLAVAIGIGLFLASWFVLDLQPLTEREQAVLSLLRKSLSVREIARELYVSGNTVKTHKRAIYRKLGVSTREEAIERAGESGAC